MVSIAEQFKPIIKQMVANSRRESVITEDNVYQTANLDNLHLFYQIVEELMLPGSGINHIEHLVELAEKAKSGKACLILMEHYSNFDLPCFLNLVEKATPQGKEIAESVIAMAGLKLNEESPVVLAFAEAFSRIIIYPSRSMASLTPEQAETELRKAKAINLAAMKALSQAKATGKLVLVFPAGTRYRPGKPETKRGVKEIDSYMKGFDHMVLIAINGNTLQVQEKGGMDEDIGHKDVIQYSVSPVLDCEAFRKQAQAETPEGEDSKQFTVDRVMAQLEVMHNDYEKERAKFLK